MTAAPDGLRWHRVGRTAGPGNQLKTGDGRTFQVLESGWGWYIWYSWDPPNFPQRWAHYPEQFRTMRAAKDKAEILARIPVV